MGANFRIRNFFAPIAIAFPLALGAQSTSAFAQEPDECLDPAACPIPYVRLSKQETEPFLFSGKVIDEYQPRYKDYGNAIAAFPDVRSCLTDEEQNKPVPELRQMDWQAISNFHEIDVCFFRVVASIEDIETVKLWLQSQGFSVGELERRRHEKYVPKSETDQVFSLVSNLPLERFREIVPRSWFARLIGFEKVRSYDFYLYFSQIGQVVGSRSYLSTILDK